MTIVEYILYVFIACSLIFIIPGPIFFLSINEAMRSLRGSLIMLLGVLTAESILLVLVDTGFMILLRHFLDILRIIGAVFLLWLGSSAIRGGIKALSADTQVTRGSSYTRGFLLTFLNPPFILWFVTVGSSLLETGIKTLGDLAYVIFSLSLLVSSAIVTLIIILSVHGGKRLIMHKIRILSLISGSGFIVIAITLIVQLLT